MAFKFDASKFYLRQETLADKLNFTKGDIESHHPSMPRMKIKWFQFGEVALLRIYEDRKIAFSVMQYTDHEQKMVYDLAIYYDTEPQELKDLLDRGEGLGDAVYKQYRDLYSLMGYINKLLM